MHDFRLCVAVRDVNGILSKPVHEQIVTAEDAVAAAAIAKTIDLDMTQLRANALYLLDTSGHVVWSLRLADVTGGSGRD